MADVDLVVAVESAGVGRAIAQIEDLRGKGLQASRSFSDLASATSRAFRTIDREVAATGRNFSGFDKAIKDTGDGARSLTGALKTLEQEYRDLTSTALGASAAQRLALGGDGSLTRGMNIAKQIEQMRAALYSDPVRDRQEVMRERERAAQEAARDKAQALADRQRARQELLASRERASEAQGRVAEARWNRELAAMSPVEAATQRVTRATQELAVATRLNNLAEARVGKNPTAANYDLQTTAANRLAAAITELQRQKEGLTRAQERENRALEAHNDNAFQSSYSYFILAGLAQQTSQALFGVAEASITATAAIERSFADVERTFEGTDTQLTSLQNRLSALSTETPISVIDLAEIATLGNQLGVAAEDIEGFTTTIAQYTAVSGESAETAATAFGRISNLTGLAASQYENLASAITYTARTTVATESTIQNTAKEISALAAGAGFSAQSIVGLAGALSSLAIPPERARGALSLYFGALNGAVAEGGPKLAAFAQLTNLTAEQLNRMVRENRGQEVFTRFIQGLSELDTVAKTSALDTLGLSTIRVDQTMRALAQNVPLVTQSFEGANRAFEENTEIANQYAIIQDTLDSKWREFANAVQNAAGEFGESFVPAATLALQVLTELLVQLDGFMDTPIGRAFANTAAGATILIGALAAAVGAASLAKASLVVLSFAVRQLGWEAAAGGVRGWVVSLVSADRAQRATALSAIGLGTAAEGASRGTRALTAALNLLKVALPLIAISAAIALATDFADRLDKIINPSKTLTDDLTGLKDALLQDNPNTIAETVDELGSSLRMTGGTPISDFNASILTAIEAQRAAGEAVDSTNDALGRQRFALGDASKAWLEETLKQQEDIKDIIDGYDFWEGVGDFFDGAFGGDGGADAKINQEQFEKLIMGGLDLNEISQMAITQGKDAALAYYREWAMGFDAANPEEGNIALTFGNEILPNVLNSVTDAYQKASIEAALAGNSIERSGIVAVATAGDFDTLGNYVGDAVSSGEALAVTFAGVQGRLDDFRAAIQSAISGTVGFDAVMSRAEETAQALADKMKWDDPKPITVANFGTALEQATTEALTFYDDLMTLAAGGNTSFALQLAELGPEAQGILSGALNLDGEGQAKLETAARFAAFLASDAFKNTLEAEMSDTNEAYARIFAATGDLSQVQDYIAAQVAGTGAAWEQQWAIDHPDLPLNVTPTLVNPTDEDLAYYSQLLSGKLTVTPTITGYIPGSGNVYGGNTFSNTANGAKITLPADLDGAALSDSLALWQQNQNATPEELEAILNQEGLSESLDLWRATNGPIDVYARIVPTNVGAISGMLNGNSYGALKKKDGGPIDHFASGGYIRGPGTPTSDSIPIWASRSEYIQNADATKFWGVDFMDSLNQKMLPTQFLNMLQAAAVSGNSGGPSHVAYVTVAQHNPLTRDPLVQLREKSEDLAAGIWGS